MDVIFGDGKLSGHLESAQPTSNTASNEAPKSSGAPTSSAPPSSRSQGTKTPGLVICSDFPSPNVAQNHEAYRPLAEQVAAELGWQVLLFSYRGCGKSKGDFSILGWLEDVCSAVKYLGSQASEVWLAGLGCGGTLAICAAARLKEVAGVVTAGANADFSDWSENSSTLLEHSRKAGFISTPGFPVNEEIWKKEFMDFNVMGCVQELAPRPLLVIHGSGNVLVSPLDARAIADAHGSSEIRIIEGAADQMAVDPRVLSIILSWLDSQVPSRSVKVE